MITISVISPGKEENDLKDQDRAKVIPEKEEHTAIVCDGTSTSPNAHQAAQIVANSVSDVFQKEDGLQNIVDNLFTEREKLLKTDIILDESQEASRSIFEEIIAEKRKISFQTTFIAAQWNVCDSKLKIKWVGCGDSALFVFDKEGELLFDNLDLSHQFKPFKHLSTFTEVLPDGYERKRHIIREEEFPLKNMCLLLCSDGFYDAFESFIDLFHWLSDNIIKEETLFRKGKELNREKVESAMSKLHEKLKNKKGDDDISFVLCSTDKPDMHLEYNYSNSDNESNTKPSDTKEVSSDSTSRNIFFF